MAGVKLPKFQHYTEAGETKNALTGLARGGQQIQLCKSAYVKVGVLKAHSCRGAAGLCFSSELFPNVPVPIF